MYLRCVVNLPYTNHYSNLLCSPHSCIEVNNAIRRSRVHAQHEERYNTQSRSLQPLHIGAEVRVQHPTTKKWDRVGVIIGIGQNRDYHVKLPSGRVYWRNRRFLRSSYGAPPNENATNDEPDDIDHDGAPTCRFQPPDGPRRSNRRRMKPKTLNL